MPQIRELSIQENICWNDKFKADYDNRKQCSRNISLQYRYKPNRRPKRVIEGKWKFARTSFLLPLVVSQSIEERFHDLATKWKNETKGLSLAASKINNNNYLAIIGMGIAYKDKITRLILQDLSETPSYWHYALRKITAQNPVPKEHMHSIQITRDRWLEWGQQNGYIA